MPVTVSGTTSDPKTTLLLKTRAFFWRGKGQADATGLTAKWGAQGFGSVIGGTGLRVGN